MIDSHMHAVDGHTGAYSDYEEISKFVSCSAKADEWDAQMTIDDPRLIKSYGVHPWYAEQWTLESKARLHEILRNDPNAHVGEIGLDTKRGQVLGQMMVFMQQMDIAEYYGRVASIHDIGCEKMVLEAVAARKMKGVILHSYGSDSYVKPFSEQECYFSISPRILSRSDIRVKRLMDAIPMDRLLLETDSPNYGGDFSGMHSFAERLASITGTSAEDLIAASEKNLGRIFE